MTFFVRPTFTIYHNSTSYVNSLFFIFLFFTCFADFIMKLKIIPLKEKTALSHANSQITLSKVQILYQIK